MLLNNTVNNRMDFSGIAASPGIGEGAAYIFISPNLLFSERVVSDIPEEIKRLRSSAMAAVLELSELKESVRARLGDEFAHIFRSQQTIAEDDSIIAEIEERIRDKKSSAEESLSYIFESYITLFSELDDSDYNKSRVADIEDVYKRILRILLGLPDVNLSTLPKKSIIIAKDLLPSDTAMMDTDQIVGMVTELGGATSHVAILANNLGIPAAVGVTGIIGAVQNQDRILLDASDSEKALVYINPTTEIHQKIERTQITLKKHKARIMKNQDTPVITRDGQEITLSANVGSTVELLPARDAGASSIGLYRSEFLFMNSNSLPSEEEQYQAYRKAAECFKEGFVIIRTLDIGGDKQLSALPLPVEDNPFLGNRALRLTLSLPDLFLTQIRAILRAGAHGSVKIMFPMVGGVPELDAALELLNQACIDLEREQIPYDRSMEIGIMVEIPSAVWMADILARHVSFFSIGTNDLTQYLLAADRLNSNVSDYYRVFDPSVFKAIKEVVRAAKNQGRWVGICGELGGNPLAIPLLVGLGVTELSMSPRAIAEASWLIREITLNDAEALADRILELDTDKKIRKVLREFYKSKEINI